MDSNGFCKPPNRIDDEARAEVEADALAAEQKRQEEQMKMLREVLEKGAAARAEIRKYEDDRMKAEATRFENQAAKLTDLKEASRVKDQERETARSKELAQRLQDAEKESTQILDNQRDFNAREKTTMLHDNRQVISGIQRMMERVEKRTAGAVMDWTKQKGQQEVELHNEKMSYATKMQAETQKFHEKEEALMIEQGNVVLELEKEKTAHKEKMAVMNEVHTVRKALVQRAYGDQVKEMTLRDAVTTSRDAAHDLSKLLANVISFRASLRTDQVTLATVNPCLEYRLKALSKLDHLLKCSQGILETQETKHPKVLECQAVAKDIITAGEELQQALQEFGQCVTKDLKKIDKSVTLDEIEKIEAAKKNLYNVMKNLPSVASSDHVANELIRCAIEIGSGNYKLTDSEKQRHKSIRNEKEEQKKEKTRKAGEEEGDEDSEEPTVEEAE